MQKTLSVLLVIALWVTSAGPVLAQTTGPVYLPLVPAGDDGAAAQSSEESQTPAATGETAQGGPVFLPLISQDAEDPGAASDAAKDAAKEKVDKVKEKKAKSKLTQKDRDDAAARALQQGKLNPLMVQPQAEVQAAPLIDGTPHYFSHPNYANSPLPVVTTTPGTEVYVGNPLTERQYATDSATNVFVALTGLPLPEGLLTSFQSWNQATAAVGAPSAGLSFHAYVLRPTGNPGEYLVAFDSGSLVVPPLTTPGVSELATFGVANLAVQAGDVLAFYGRGVPLDIGAGSDSVSYPAPTPPAQGSTLTLGAGDFPILNQARTYSFGAQVVDMTAAGVTISGGLRKFVDALPTLGPSGANGLGQYLSVATADETTYPGADYYEIALVEYEKQMHSDLPPTKLRGYVQLETANVQGAHYDLGNGRFAVDPPQYLGTAIAATKDKPVRIKFYNLLPTGMEGNLFIPVDSTVMGSGMTPDGHEWMEANPEMVDPQNPMCSGPDKAMMVANGHCFADTRATLHLHGGISPWISDGTPHQWITPAGENTPYPQGVSVRPVPDMDDNGDPADGVMTFYYTNQQSARLMFYHDHAWGITRLNVYAGEAAPYLISDDTEQALVNGGIIPGPDATIPLVVQDKTFVPNDAQLALQDETWDTARWGGEGSLWIPHVYSPAQNPGDASGVNEYGRWAYGPWFWPPTNGIEYGPVANPYFDPNCDPDLSWCEPPLMPGVPFNSMGMESFNDTPVVNGTAYPTLEVEPKAYRFRILNAANDRFFNLSLYKAVDANGVLCDSNNPTPAPESTGVACTEVALNPDEVAAALEDSTIFPTPLPGTEGPDWIAFGTEGGFLPAPVVVPAHVTTWVNDPTVFNAGNVDQHSLLTAPAERHDVIVDFSQYAGQTLILYNDAPAAFPARDPRYDYYTGNGDYRETGGASSTLPGYGPNTRTVMQIKVADVAPAPAFDLAALNNAFAHQPDGSGVFESGQNPIIVGQGEYNTAYGTTFQSNGPRNGTVQIYDTSISFDTLAGIPLTINLKPKMIQDEMGEAFEHEYGRMSGFLGVETPNAQAGLQNMILHGYTFPPDEVLDGVELPPGVEVEPIASADDGTQIWKFTHNGVDTHPIHFHLYDVQLLNRVGWDGIVRKPHATELGWKDTVRISPLEDTIVAMRPIIPHLPEAWGGLPNSIRLLDPSMPEGVYLEGANTTQREAMGLPLFAFNPDGEPVDIVNHAVNFGWEYVYHCHILSHEEMDMMHAQVVGVAPNAPAFDPVTGAVRSGNGANRRYTITWTDNSKNETGFVVERRVAGSGADWQTLQIVPSDALVQGPETGGTRSYVDPIGNTNTLYEYRVYAINVVGDSWDYSNPAFNEIAPGGGWPTLTLTSLGEAMTPVTVAAPTNLAAATAVKNRNSANVTLSWTDNANNETGFLVQRADNAAFTLGVVNATVGSNVTSLTQTLPRARSYYYRVHAFSDTSQSGWSTTINVVTP